MDWVYTKGRNPSTGNHETLRLYTYEHYVEGINELARQIRKRPDYFCGVHRGGLIPAVHLSYKMKAPLLTLDTIQGSAPYIKEILTNPKHNVIMVDEIIHSGESANKINQMFDREFKWATLVLNTNQPYIKDPYYHMINETDEYTIFWWGND